MRIIGIMRIIEDYTPSVLQFLNSSVPESPVPIPKPIAIRLSGYRHRGKKPFSIGAAGKSCWLREVDFILKLWFTEV